MKKAILVKIEKIATDEGRGLIKLDTLRSTFFK
jgi:hypothetical protein